MEQYWIKKNRILVIVILFLLLCLVAGWILYALFSHQIIKDMYEGKSLEVLNRLIRSRELRPLEYYFQEADWLFFNMSTFFCIGVLLLFLTCLGKRDVIFYGIIISYGLYCAIFIIKTSFIVDGVRHFILFDDVMIGMRYAKNLVQGHGLVWNPGERVEGYTTILWVLYMAFWHLFHISSAKISLPIQISNVIFLIGSLYLVKEIASDISRRNRYVLIGAVLLTATYIPINFWGLRGMEISALGFAVLLILWRFFRCLNTKNFDPFLFFILGIGLLLRADFAFLYIGISLFIITILRENRMKNALAALSIFLLIMGAQTVFRWFYYKDIFPNTYYLKVAGISPLLRMQRGIWAAKEFIMNMSLFLFALPFAYCILQRRNKKVCFLLYIFLLQLFYSIYVGGDAWEDKGHLANRYLCIVMPAFFILTSLMVSYLIEKIKVFRINYSGNTVILKKCFFGIIMLIIIFQLHGGFIETLVNFLGIHIDRDQNMVKVGLKLKEITTPDVKIAVVWAGTIPYFSERYCIGLLGINDTFIAQQTVRHQRASIAEFKYFRPGHNKFDYNYSIGQLKPDIVAQLWGGDDDQADAFKYLDKDYKAVKIKGIEMELACMRDNKIFLRKDSTNIHWDKIKAGIMIKDK